MRDRSYYNPPKGFRADNAGYTAASGDQVFDAVDWAFDNNVQILVHANGEGASDMLIGAIDPRRRLVGRRIGGPVLIHGQFLHQDQEDAYNRREVFPSLFPMHTFYWGDRHRDRTVGPVASDNISPTGWVHARGMMFSSQHDAPVAFPDSMRILDATVTRRSIVAVSNDLKGAGRAFGRVRPAFGAAPLHSGACVARTLGAMITASLVRDASVTEPRGLKRVQHGIGPRLGRVLYSAHDLSDLSHILAPLIRKHSCVI